MDEQGDSPKTRSLDLLRAAGISPPVPFDAEGMWRELGMLFVWEQMDREVSKAPKKADQNAIGMVLSAALALQSALALLDKPERAKAAFWLKNRMPAARTALEDLVPARDDGGYAYINLLLQARLSLAREEVQAIAQAAREAGKLLAQNEVELTPGVSEIRALPAGRLFLNGFPKVFERFVRRKATFTPQTAVSPRSACIRFIQAAYVAFGRVPPTDADIITSRKRVTKATGTRRRKS